MYCKERTFITMGLPGLHNHLHSSGYFTMETGVFYFFNAFILIFSQRNKEVFIADFEFRERMFTSITDLVSLAIFLGISPGVKEAMTAYLRGDDKKDLTPYKNFLKQTALIQK